MPEHPEDLKNQLRLVLGENQKLREKLEKQETEIAELKRQLHRYENPHTPPSKDQRVKAKKRPPKHGRPGRPSGFKGCTRPQPVPDRTERVELETCPHCAATLGKPVKVERSIVEEIPEPQPIEAVCYETLHYHCKVCGSAIVSKHPDKPKSGRLGANAQIKIALMKYDLRLPHRKTVDALVRDFKLGVVPATVWNTTKSVAGHLKPTYWEMVKSLRESECVYIDETGFKVDGKQWWLWVFVTKDATVFALRKSRGVRVVREMLGRKYDGVIISDGHRSYATYSNKRQRCWAHLLRELKELAEKSSVAKCLYLEVLKLYNEVVEALGKDPPPHVRRMIHDKAKAHLDWLLTAKRRGRVGAFVKKMRTASASLFTFVLHPGVEPTNNIAERALRENVVMRKIIGTLRNAFGAEVHETIMSVLATCKQLGQNPYEVLKPLLCCD
jgi:transposase